MFYEIMMISSWVKSPPYFLKVLILTWCNSSVLYSFIQPLITAFDMKNNQIPATTAAVAATTASASATPANLFTSPHDKKPLYPLNFLCIGFRLLSWFDRRNSSSVPRFCFLLQTQRSRKEHLDQESLAFHTSRPCYLPSIYGPLLFLQLPDLCWDGEVGILIFDDSLLFLALLQIMLLINKIFQREFIARFRHVLDHFHKLSPSFGNYLPPRLWGEIAVVMVVWKQRKRFIFGSSWTFFSPP